MLTEEKLFLLGVALDSTEGVETGHRDESSYQFLRLCALRVNWKFLHLCTELNFFFSSVHKFPQSTRVSPDDNSGLLLKR